MHSLEPSLAAPLGHLLVAGGTPGEWAEMPAAAWADRVAMLADQAAAAGAQWVTVRTSGPDAGFDPEDDSLPDGAWPAAPVLHGSVSVIVDPEPVARNRVARVLRDLADTGITPASLTEQRLGAALLAPATVEPDLAVLLGSENRLPQSLTWELAYAELVFVDSTWTNLDAVHVKAAIAEYYTRSRRFGGVES